MLRLLIPLWLLLTGFTCGPDPAPTPSADFFARWMLIDEPVLNALAIGTMWDGVQPRAGCFQPDTVIVDTTGVDYLQTSSRDRSAGLGLQVLQRVGLGGAVQRAATWEFRAYGARVALGQSIAPTPGTCASLRDQLPSAPVIAALIGFDSVRITGTTVDSASLRLTPADLGRVLQLSGGQASSADSNTLTFTQDRFLWVGYRLWGIEPRGTDRCEWEQLLGGTEGCDDEDAFPHRVRVRALAADFELQVQNPALQFGRITTDTLGEGFALAVHLPVDSTMQVGEWWRLAVRRTPQPSVVRVSSVRQEYRIRRFTGERDRDALRRFIER